MNLPTILQNLKFAKLLRPQLKDDGDFANNTYIDTLDMVAVGFLFFVGDTDVAAGDAVGSGGEDVAPYIEECDIHDGQYTAVSSAALSDSIQHDDDNTLHMIVVDKRKTTKRYMRVHEPHSAAGAAAGSNLAILAIGVPDNKFPATDAERGLAELVVA